MVGPFKSRHLNYLKGVSRPAANLLVQLVNLTLPLRCLPLSQAIGSDLRSHADRPIKQCF